MATQGSSGKKPNKPSSCSCKTELKAVKDELAALKKEVQKQTVKWDHKAVNVEGQPPKLPQNINIALGKRENQNWEVVTTTWVGHGGVVIILRKPR